MKLPYTNRRSFLKTGAALAAGLALPLPVARALEMSHGPGLGERPEYNDYTTYHTLATLAVDAARAAGAAFATAQIRVTRNQWFYMFSSDERVNSGPQERYALGASVRVLVNGYWGHVAFHGLPTRESMTEAAAAAVQLAKISAGGRTKPVELAPAPVVRNGRWSTPVQIDPFTISEEEKIDFGEGLMYEVGGLRFGNESGMTLNFFRDDQIVATSDGSEFHQTRFQCDGKYWLNIPISWQNEAYGGWHSIQITPRGAGWEHFSHGQWRAHADQLYPTALLVQRKQKPVDIGRYDVVFDARTTAHLLSQTLQQATELDRALGEHANSLGTSFLDDPLAMLGSYQIAAPIVTVRANRSMPEGAATVQWDDEGVVPVDTTLIRQGVLNDFQTTRESAMTLEPYYTKQGRAVQSNGCAGAETIVSQSLQVPPNIELEPGTGTATFDEFVAGVENGIAILNGEGDVDYQILNGGGDGIAFEIKNGKLGERIYGAQYLYRTPEFWKSVSALGGAASREVVGITRAHRYMEMAAHSVTAVPMVVKNVRVSDVMRRM